jgi:hypothetical protein
LTDVAGSEVEAIESFRAAAEAMGIDRLAADELIEDARKTAEAGGISLADALREELAELAVHLGKTG